MNVSTTPAAPASNATMSMTVVDHDNASILLDRDAMTKDAARIDLEIDPFLAKGKPGSDEVDLDLRVSNELSIGKTDHDEPFDVLPGQVDGGLYAWLSVIVTFATYFSAFGLHYAYGLFQDWYQRYDFPDASPSSLALAGALQPASMFLCGIVVGDLSERVPFRTVVFAGTIVIGIAIALASFATQVWHLCLTQGVLFGVGCSLVYYPVTSLPSQWWVKNRSLATGIGMAGSGAGPLVYSLVISELLPRLGSKVTLRVMGAGTVAILLVATALIRTRFPARRRSTTNADSSIWTPLRDRRLQLILASRLCISIGYLLPFVFLPNYVVAVVGAPPSFAALLLTLINALSFAGRIITGWLADRAGNVNMYALSILLTGSGTLALWLPAGNVHGMLIAYASVFGLTAGAYIALLPSVLAQLFGAHRLPSMLGSVAIANAVGNLAGPPIAGALITAGKGALWSPALDYGGAIVFSGVVMAVGALIMVYMRFAMLDGHVWAKH
ncbi:hypothetical protein GGF31_007183 [Allomyces arbusculus]|nr:hypothetical protein GGF31_007183 [Allomyces arbusculus]